MADHDDSIRIDGKPQPIDRDQNLASALWRDGVRATRVSSRAGEGRSALCGMGTCHECRVVVDGRDARACLRPCTPGLDVVTRVAAPVAQSSIEHAIERDRFDVLVVGAGPAGTAAALAAVRGGRRVAVLDEHLRAGGPIWRNDARPPARARRMVAALSSSAVVRIPSTGLVDAMRLADGSGFSFGLVDDDGTPRRIDANAVVLATGAVERFLPFPGWTLPGVTGVGGLQALAKRGLDVRGRTVVVAGTGPLLLAAAATLRAGGARVHGPFDQAPAARVRGFTARLLTRAPAKIFQAMRLAARAGRPFGPICDTWPVAALPADDGERLGAVRLRDGRGRERMVTTDFLACAYGLVPRIELAALLGCRIAPGDARGGAHVVADATGRTDVDGVWACGESTGVAGVDAAIHSGTAAGLDASGEHAAAKPAGAKASRARSFGTLLERTFALRDELGSLPEDDTIVCRCEDVRWAEIRSGDFFDTRDAKLKTRCGMGVCQGKVCGPALEYLQGWPRDRVRPPLAPVPVSAFAALAESAG